MIECTARAAPNFALVKYWGKARDRDMIPASPSLSITLDGPLVEVTVSAGEGEDAVLLGGAPVPEPWRERTQTFLDLVRTRAGSAERVRIEARGGPYPATGLASSASYFAALAHAASRAFGLDTDERSVSDLARMGSISAARSVPGGFVVLDPAGEAGGRLAAETILMPHEFPVAVVIAVVKTGMKQVGSSEGMRRTRDTSPFYDAWIASGRPDLERALAALAARDIESLGRVAEGSCLRMHACAMAADPPVVYVTGVTLAAIERVKELRARGAGCFYTVDAGPQVKVVCLPEDVVRVREGMKAVGGVREVLVRGPGRGSLLSTSGRNHEGAREGRA